MSYHYFHFTGRKNEGMWMLLFVELKYSQKLSKASDI